MKILIAIPIEVMLSASKIIANHKLNITIKSANEEKTMLEIELEYDKTSPIQQKAIENIQWMVNEYRTYMPEKT